MPRSRRPSASATRSTAANVLSSISATRSRTLSRPPPATRFHTDRAVALGLLAALRLSGLPDDAQLVEGLLRPQPVRVDREAAWAALSRDKKADGGSPRLVLAEAPGRLLVGVELDVREIRAALDSLIA